MKKQTSIYVFIAGFITLLMFIAGIFVMRAWNLSEGESIALWFGIVLFCIFMFAAIGLHSDSK